MEKQESENKFLLSSSFIGAEELQILHEMIDEPVFKKDNTINALVKEHLSSVSLSIDEKNIIKFQIYMLAASNDDGMNALHVSCMNGSAIIKFVIQQADRLRVRDYLVNKKES